MTVKNWATSTIATAPSPASSGTSLAVASGHGSRFAAGEPATIWPAGASATPANAEVVLITAISTDTLTLIRAQEGSAARTVVVGDSIEQAITAGMWGSHDRNISGSPMVNGSRGIWQRGNGPFTADGAFTADGWRIALGSGSTLSVERDTTEVAGVYSAACAKLTHVLGSAPSRLYEKYQDWAQARTKELTYSEHVKTATAGAVRLAIWDGLTRTYSPYHTGGGAYERLAVTKTPASAGTTLELEVWCDVSVTAYVDNGQWLYGGYPVAYWSADPAIEKLRCLRYYALLPIRIAWEALVNGESRTFPLAWPVEVGANPVVAVVTTGTRTNINSIAYTATDNDGGYVTIVAEAPGAVSVSGETISVTGDF